MDKLYSIYNTLLAGIDTHFIRYLHNRIDWSLQLNIVLGCRGVGKTTLLLQHIKLAKEQASSLYVSADNPYFSTHTLYDTADTFYKQGGRHIYIDEVHKYPHWSSEVKMMHDIFPELKITLSGSSMIDLIKGLKVDLSRRAIPYKMEGLSFREYLNYTLHTSIPSFTLSDILQGQAILPETIQHPLPLFADYLQHGYYPFFTQKEYLTRLDNTVAQTLDVDIPQQTNMSIATARKLKKLLYVVAQSTPFKPNLSQLGRTLEADRSTVADMLAYMERAGLIRQLRTDDNGMNIFSKTEKIYLNNTNLCYALCDGKPDIGNLRETTFLSSMSVNHTVTASPVSDFLVDGFTFEVGGRNKTRKQVANIKNAYIVKDDIEHAYLHTIPLWMFGLNY